MEDPPRQQKKVTKQLTAKPDDSPFHAAARAGNLDLLLQLVGEASGDYGDAVELKNLLAKQSQSGKTALYVAAECGHADIVKELINHYDTVLAGIKARNGYDALNIAAKQDDSETLRVLMEANPDLAMTFDWANTTALHSAAAQGHVEVADFLLERCGSVVAVAKSNGKTALHSAARNGHLQIVKSLLSKVPGITTRVDKKGQTALHMAVKGQNVDLVDELVMSDPSLINMVDNKGNIALHIAARKGRTQIVRKLLDNQGLDKVTINRSGETAFDTAAKSGHNDITSMLEKEGVLSAKSMKPNCMNRGRALKQTVYDIRYKIHNQLETTRITRKRMQGISKRMNKMHTEGLDNAINSITVLAVLIATLAFAAILQVPGQYVDNPDNLAPGQSAGQARMASKLLFMIFIVFDSVALFISLAVVVVQTSIVVIERKAKKQMMTVINKLMWLACVLISVAFIVLSYVVVGNKAKWLAIGVTIIGTLIMTLTIGMIRYSVVMARLEQRDIRRSLMSRSRSGSMSGIRSIE